MRKNVKIGSVDPEIIYLNGSPKTKEINASKIYSPVGKFAELAKKKLWLRARETEMGPRVPSKRLTM